jgi:hypothetical protein
MPCAVCHVRHAVYDCNHARFYPCRECMKTGWHLRKLCWWERLLIRERP